MRITPIVLAAAAFSVLSSGAQAISIAFGNHEGGLIPSPPDLRNRAVQAEIAQTASQHCASYDRIAHITGVVPGYGNYVSFTCRFHPAYDPVKSGAAFPWFWR